jgi:hypothetical protein
VRKLTSRNDGAIDSCVPDMFSSRHELRPSRRPAAGRSANCCISRIGYGCSATPAVTASPSRLSHSSFAGEPTHCPICCASMCGARCAVSVGRCCSIRAGVTRLRAGRCFRWQACDLIMRLHEEFGISVSDDTIYRAPQRPGILASQRPSEGLQTGPRGHGGVQKTFPPVWRKSARSSRQAHR